ncbi:MAG TPA: hypothetical protein P5511_03945, partial [Candidatus Goldiibacteriota bacterium]|nr:hypothetical protein [Candidatus Goldiibacteriota bacterium]
TIPASPFDITGIGGTPYSTYVYLSWTANPDYDAKTFNVFYRASGQQALVQAGSTTQNNMSITGLINGMGYTFLVTSENALGSSNTFNAAACVITPTSANLIGKPMNFKVDSEGNSSLTLYWDPVTGAARYHIYRSLEPNQTADTLIATVSVNSYVDFRGFTDNALYWYKVAAVDSLGQPGADFSDIKGNSAFTKAGEPMNVEINNIPGGMILAWTPPTAAYTYNSGALKYRIYRSTFGQGDFGQPKAETLSNIFIDTGINTSAQYAYYRIIPVDSANYEGGSGIVYSVEVKNQIDPPSVLTARPGDRRVTLSWKKVSPESYNIYRSTYAGGFTSPIAYGISFDGKEYIDADPALLNLTRYFYCVSAVTGAGEGKKTPPVSAVPYAAPSISYSKVTATVANKRDIQLSWTRAEASSEGYAVSGYKLYRSADNGWTYTLAGEIPYIVGPSYVTNYTDTGASWGNKYTYLLRVVDDMGNTDAVYDPAEVELPLPKNRLRLYANMLDLSKGEQLKWRYVITKPGRLKVKVFTLSGSFVKMLADEEYKLQASETEPYESQDYFWDGKNEAGMKVASGIYILMLEMDGVRVAEKVAVIK